MDRAKAISRVRKLRALAAEGSGATEPERELAASRALRLIARFDLSEAEISPEPVPTLMPLWQWYGGSTTSSCDGATVVFTVG